MLYALRVGPISFENETEQAYAYLGFTEEGLLPPAIENDDEAGLQALLAQTTDGGSRECEPELIEIGQKLGFKAAPIPEELLRDRAVLATAFALGNLAEEMGPAILEAALEAYHAFLDAEPFAYFADEDALEVTITMGGKQERKIASILGRGGQEVGVALFPDRATMQRLLDSNDGAGEAPEALAIESMALTLDEEPEFAAKATEAGFGFYGVPVPIRTSVSGPLVPTAEDVRLLCAVMHAVSALGPKALTVDFTFEECGEPIAIHVVAPPARDPEDY